MKYDDLDWHLTDDVPEHALKAAGIHIGMFIAWCAMNELLHERFAKDVPELLAALLSRKITGTQFLEQCCDGSLTDEDLNDAGNSFAAAYYGLPVESSTPPYEHDFQQLLLGDLSGRWQVHDTWANYDLIAPRIDDRYQGFLANKPDWNK